MRSLVLLAATFAVCILGAAAITEAEDDEYHPPILNPHDKPVPMCYYSGNKLYVKNLDKVVGCVITSGAGQGDDYTPSDEGHVVIDNKYNRAKTVKFVRLYMSRDAPGDCRGFYQQLKCQGSDTGILQSYKPSAKAVPNAEDNAAIAATKAELASEAAEAAAAAATAAAAKKPKVSNKIVKTKAKVLKTKGSSTSSVSKQMSNDKATVSSLEKVLEKADAETHKSLSELALELNSADDKVHALTSQVADLDESSLEHKVRLAAQLMVDDDAEAPKSQTVEDMANELNVVDIEEQPVLLGHDSLESGAAHKAEKKEAASKDNLGAFFGAGDFQKADSNVAQPALPAVEEEDEDEDTDADADVDADVEVDASLPATFSASEADKEFADLDSTLDLEESKKRLDASLADLAARQAAVENIDSTQLYNNDDESADVEFDDDHYTRNKRKEQQEQQEQQRDDSELGAMMPGMNNPEGIYNVDVVAVADDEEDKAVQTLLQTAPKVHVSELSSVSPREYPEALNNIEMWLQNEKDGMHGLVDEIVHQ